jgi:hypothetical protein
VLGLVSGSYDRRLKYWDVSSLYSSTTRAGPQLPDPYGAILEEAEREFLGHAVRVPGASGFSCNLSFCRTVSSGDCSRVPECL